MNPTALPTRRTWLLGAALSLVVLPCASSGRAEEHRIRTRAEHEPLQQPVNPTPQSFMALAEQMRQRALDAGDQGYGAVVTRDGRLVGQAPSRVIVNGDPTAHAEMEAIRDAARRLGTRSLAGATLYSSSRPCPMCEAAAYWAGIETLVYTPALAGNHAPSLCR